MEQALKPLHGALCEWVIDRAPDPIVVLGPRGGVEYVNRAAREQFDFDAAGALAAGAGGSELGALFSRLNEQGQASAEVRLPGGAKGPCWVTIHGSVVEGRTILQLRHASARRLEQAELRRLRRLEAVGHLTASVVHDFNNILAIIMNSGALLERDVEGIDYLVALTQEIRWAAERGSHLVARVRSLLRGDEGWSEGVDVRRLLDEVGPLMARVLGDQSKLDMRVQGEGDVLIDRERLVQVLLNLAANARDAMPGGGTLTVSAFDLPSRDGPAGRSDGYVALLLTDTGAGMSKEQCERIFDGFFTTKGPDAGTGLGLASAYRFVTDSGGHMSLRSEPGEGTTVALYLPRDPRRSRPTIAPDAAPPPDGLSPSDAAER